jgi:excisionase family DNA binding protein
VRLEVVLTDEQLDAIAQRAAALILARAQPSPAGPYLSVDEAAELLRAKPQRVYDLLSSGRLTRRKDGSRVLVERAEIERMLAGESYGRVAHRLPTVAQGRIARRVST